MIAAPTGDGERVMQMARWGMPTPPRYLKPGAIDRGVTNVRDTRSPHWYAWLMPVLLTTPDEQATWLSTPLEQALKLQRPLPDDALRMVAIVDKADEWVPAA